MSYHTIPLQRPLQAPNLGSMRHKSSNLLLGQSSHLVAVGKSFNLIFKNAVKPRGGGGGGGAQCFQRKDICRYYETVRIMRHCYKSATTKLMPH